MKKQDKKSMINKSPLVFLPKNKINELPILTGVYIFKGKNKFLYIGKAINIKKRVKNHFLNPLPKDNVLLKKTEKIGFIITDSEIEALVLESNLIKKYQPLFNLAWRDDKSYFFVFLTKENFPRLLIGHNNLKYKIKTPIAEQIGPFVEGKSLKLTLRFLRRIFPFRICNKMPKIPCLDKSLNLCPAPCEKKDSDYVKYYQKNIKNILAILKGKKKVVFRELEKSMQKFSQQKDFENAALVRNQIQKLKNTLENSNIFQKEPVSLSWQKTEKILKRLLNLKKEQKIQRVEAYDISNISGKEATGSMVVMENGLLKKNDYRRFRIKSVKKPNDPAMLTEIIIRRLNHKEWKQPQMILLDGGKSQLNAVLKIKKGNKKFALNPKKIIFGALAKKENKLFLENKKEALFLKDLSPMLFRLFLLLRDEAHRFAFFYHQKLRKKKVLGKK